MGLGAAKALGLFAGIGEASATGDRSPPTGSGERTSGGGSGNAKREGDTSSASDDSSGTGTD